jgi:lipopolysaccharide/colanic/teichoic acid biosynthesis glycosyltransferase
VGHNGRRFRIFKFRTMKVGAATEAHRAYYNQLMSSNLPMAKLDGKGDQRLVPGGWILRGSGLDELPQLINVLKGDMSLVGPRPCIPYEYEEYTPWQKQRFKTLPGLTGLWQVSGKNRTTFEEMIRLDHEYGDNLSLWMDVRIILMTGPAIFLQVYDARVARKKEARSREEFRAIRSDPPASVIQSPKVNL